MAPAAVPQVTVFWDPDQELYHTCYIYSGLLELARAGAITLRTEVPSPDSWRKAEIGELVVFAQVGLASSPPIEVCWDLRDRSDRFATRALDRVQVYFRRSYFRPDVDALGSTSARIIPFGINHPTRASGLVAAAVRAMLLAGLSALPRLRARRLQYWAAGLRTLLAIRPTAEFLCDAETPKEHQVLYQTRVWPPQAVRDDDAEAVNAERVAIIRALREAFGPRAHAGVPPSDFARRYCPDLILAGQTTPRRYIRLNRRLLVGVYSRGLHHSTAWKLGEYLAASMCVVGSPVRNALPFPLRDGIEMSHASAPEHVVRRVAAILDSPALQQTMRRAAQDYYRRHIDPAAHLQWSLNEGLRPAGALPA